MLTQRRRRAAGQTIPAVLLSSKGPHAGPEPQKNGVLGCDNAVVHAAPRLLRRGLLLEYATLGWNVVGVIVLALTAVTARSVALAGFGLDSLIEIGASTVVVWELTGTGEERQRHGLRLI